jgi:hypothetical protein
MTEWPSMAGRRGHGTIHRFGRQGGRRESLPRGLVVVRSHAGRAAQAIGLALGCNGSTRLHNGACKSAGPRISFVGGYPIPHFKQAKPISLSL